MVCLNQKVFKGGFMNVDEKSDSCKKDGRHKGVLYT